MSNAVALVELVASASDSLDERPKTNCFGCPDERTIYTRIWQGIAIASFAINLAAMIIVDESIIMIVAGIVACLIAPVVIYLQFQIQDTDSTFVLYILYHIICDILFDLYDAHDYRRRVITHFCFTIVRRNDSAIDSIISLISIDK
jgi:hypothetical protein